MAIQFFCSGCGQPIEVDDNLANLAVTCPYCRKVVTTPAATTLAAAPTVPVTPFSPAAVPEPLPYGATVAAPRKKAVLGWIAFASAILTIILGLYSVQTFGSLMQGLNMQPKGEQEMQEFQKAFQERAQQRPGFLLGSCSGVCLFPIAAVVCGIIGLVRREQPRWPAIASLVLFGLAIALNCMGLMRIAAASGGGA